MVGVLPPDRLKSQAHPDVIVSVIISTRNGSRILRDVLADLLNGTRKPNEIVVLDQSDDDLTRNLVSEVQNSDKGQHVRYVASDRPGLCAHRNDAIRAAKGDFIASVDDDISVDENWLARMLDEWVGNWDKKPVLITGRILPDPGVEDTTLITATRTDSARHVYAGQPRMFNVLVGGQFGASRELYESLSPVPFDERLGVGSQFPGGDDDEFAYRVMKAGWPVVYEPSIVVVHRARPTTKWRHMMFTRAIGGGASMAKHVLRGDMFVLFKFFEFVVTQIVKSVKMIFTEGEPKASGCFVASVGATYGFLAWIVAQHTGRLILEDGLEQFENENVRS
jgi:glycosyltransferase involved in cell wall biosynthesis